VTPFTEKGRSMIVLFKVLGYVSFVGAVIAGIAALGEGASWLVFASSVVTGAVFLAIAHTLLLLQGIHDALVRHDGILKDEPRTAIDVLEEIAAKKAASRAAGT
jgi:hypothetical protein